MDLAFHNPSKGAFRHSHGKIRKESLDSPVEITRSAEVLRLREFILAG
jgi:hypothetical protein